MCLNSALRSGHHNIPSGSSFDEAVWIINRAQRRLINVKRRAGGKDVLFDYCVTEKCPIEVDSNLFRDRLAVEKIRGEMFDYRKIADLIF